MVSSGDSSHGHEGDQLEVLQAAPASNWVPLLSPEGLTGRLLPGATAPYPALDQAMKFPAESQRFVSKVPAAAGIVFVVVDE